MRLGYKNGNSDVLQLNFCFLNIICHKVTFSRKVPGPHSSCMVGVRTMELRRLRLAACDPPQCSHPTSMCACTQTDTMSDREKHPSTLQG